jgi:hypothetical protein
MDCPSIATERSFGESSGRAFWYHDKIYWLTLTPVTACEMVEACCSPANVAPDAAIMLGHEYHPLVNGYRPLAKM